MLLLEREFSDCTITSILRIGDSARYWLESTGKSVNANGISDGLIRLSIGLEDVDDLIG